jgi:hypothetical protein
MKMDSKVIETLIKMSFKEVYGYIPKSVTDMNGNPPGEENNWLYSQAFRWYRGKVSLGGGYEMTFSVFKEGESWKAEFIPIE